MKRTFFFRDGKSAKFWEISYGHDMDVHLRWGKIGSDGQQKKKSFSSIEVATREAEKMLQGKLKKGYQEETGAEPQANAEKAGGDEIRSDEDYLSSWEKLTEAKDLNRALTEHFGFLADTPGFEVVLEEVMALATEVKIEKESLHILFGDDDETLIAGPPKLGPYANYPKSARCLFGVHGAITAGDLVLGAHHYLDFGIYEDTDNVYRLFEGNYENMQEPLWDCAQNTHWLYHPSAKNSHGEPALFPIVHEEEDLIELVDANVGSVFLNQLVELQQWPIIRPDLESKADEASTQESNWWEGLMYAVADQETLFHFSDDPPLKGPFPKTQLQTITRLSFKWLAEIQPLPLDDMPALKELSVNGGTGKKDVVLTCLDGIERASSLEKLTLDNHRLTSIEGLSALKAMHKLSLRNNQIQDVSPLQGLTELEHLYLSDNPIKDISPLSGCNKIKVIWVCRTGVRDFDVIGSFPHLKSVSIPTRMNEAKEKAFKKERPEVDISY